MTVPLPGVTILDRCARKCQDAADVYLPPLLHAICHFGRGKRPNVRVRTCTYGPVSKNACQGGRGNLQPAWPAASKWLTRLARAPHRRPGYGPRTFPAYLAPAAVHESAPLDIRCHRITPPRC